MIVYIYCLSDPAIEEIRYVGKTINPANRIKDHRAARRAGTHRVHWIKSVISRGVVPILEILETIENSDDTDWQEAERFWISYLRFIGCKLVNQESGGQGGKKLSPEHVAKIRSKNLGKKRSPEIRSMMSSARRGVPNPKTAAALAGRKLPAEIKSAISKALKGRNRPPEVIEKIRLGSIGKKLSPESIAKRTASRNYGKWKPEWIAKRTATFRSNRAKKNSDTVPA